MSNLFISNIYYKTVVDKGSKIPRPHFIRYYDDLYQLEREESVDSESHLAGAQLSYAELGDIIFQDCKLNKLKKMLDLMVVTYWSHEFDPDHACGAYFCHRHGLNCRILDICDQGILSPFTAFLLIKNYMEYGGVKNALLLSMDQTTIPRSLSYSNILPEISSVSAIHLTLRQIGEKGCEIIYSDVVSGLDEKKVTEYLHGLIHILSINKAQVHCFSDDRDKKLQHELSINFLNTTAIIFKMNSVEPIAYLLRKSLSNKNNLKQRYYALIKKDVDSNDFGILILKIG